MSRSDNGLDALRRILRASDMQTKAIALAAGLTPVQLRVLHHIAAQGQTTATRIAGHMVVTQATVTALVNKLCDKGMVERRQSQQDRRQIAIHITDAGRQAIAQAPDALAERYVAGLSAMAVWEQAMTVAVLERIAQMLDGAGANGPAPIGAAPAALPGDDDPPPIGKRVQ
ncbi:MAG: MarR family winged helix-turn-helix transcriptional regulator [Paracoccus sp. (in: a-proteobacteria)]|nr:MarR family winged helix-turn-helix transcriptional regulator [Paracoccus sp. (in: a-proteobacteria)]